MSNGVVVFTSARKLSRAENVNAVYSEYKGNKIFRRYWTANKGIDNASAIVCDEFPWSTKWNKSIMVTHGIPLTKLYGLDMPNSWVTPDSVEYMIAPSKESVPIIAKQGGIPTQRVLPLGMPRFDAYIGKVKGDGETDIVDKRAYLYAPTFRDSTNGEGRLPAIDLDYIDAKLEDNELFIIKLHMTTKKKIAHDRYRHIRVVDNDVPSTPYLIDCDILITDYSSILFDAHALHKPVVLFEKDAERYLSKRGMYFDYPYGYASRHCRSEDDLIDIMRSAKTPCKEDERIRNLAAGACDGHSVERLIDMIDSLCN